MPDIIIPDIIQGPTIVRQSGPAGRLYWLPKTAVSHNLKREVMELNSMLYGNKLQQRLKSQTRTIGFTPSSVRSLFLPSSVATYVTAIAVAGTGYSVGDVLTLGGGTLATGGTATQVKVLTVSEAGAVLTAKILTPATRGLYSAAPTNPCATTVAPSGGTNCTLTMRFETVSQWMPYCASDIGVDILKLSSSTLIEIFAKNEGMVYSYPQSALTKIASPLHLKASDEMLGGGVEFICLGSADGQPVDEDEWMNIAEAQFPQPDFDINDILTDQYEADFASGTAIGSATGFEVDFAAEVKPLPPDMNTGVRAVTLDGFTATVKCAPNNMTDAELEALLRSAGAEALLIGQPVSDPTANLVITGRNSGAVFTLYGCGPKDAQRTHESGQHRFKEVDFVSERRYTAGVPQPLFAFDAE